MEDKKLLATEFVEARYKQLGTVANHINEYKVPELIFTGEDDVNAMKKFLGTDLGSTIIPEGILASESWRDARINGIKNIAKSVVLSTEKVEFGEGVQYQTEEMFSATSDSGPLKTVKNVIEGANAAINTMTELLSGGTKPAPMPEDSFISRYSGMRYLKSIQSTGISDVTFKFRVGQGGLFDAKEEVVAPILAIACCFAPQREGNGFISGPAPTKSKIMSTVVETLFTDLNSSGAGSNLKDKKYSGYFNIEEANSSSAADNNLSAADWELIDLFRQNSNYYGGEGAPLKKNGDKFANSWRKTILDEGQEHAIIAWMKEQLGKTGANSNNTETTEGVLGTIANVEKALMNALNKAAYAALTGGKTTTCSIKIGHMLFGPYFCGNINYSFDYTNVDENGWPCSGYIQLSDLKPCLTIDRFDIRAKMGVSYDEFEAEDDGVWRCPVRNAIVTSPFGPRISPTQPFKSVTSSYSLAVAQYTRARDESLRFGNTDLYNKVLQDLNITNHEGVDLKGMKGDGIYAAYNGTVISVEQNNRTFGGIVKIKHDGEKAGWETWYCHMSAISVEPNEKVFTGQRIGRMGGVKGEFGSGESTGPHLHFQMMKGGAQNPAPEIAEIGSACNDTTSGKAFGTGQAIDGTTFSY